MNELYNKWSFPSHCMSDSCSVEETLTVSYLLLWFGPCLAVSVSAWWVKYFSFHVSASVSSRLPIVLNFASSTFRWMLTLLSVAETYSHCQDCLLVWCVHMCVCVSYLCRNLWCVSPGFHSRLLSSGSCSSVYVCGVCMYNAAAGCCCLECPFLPLF